MKIEVAIEIKSLLGECPIWSHRDQCLYWLDMYKPAIYRFWPNEKRNEQLAVPNINYVSSFVPRKKKGFILGVPTGLVFYDEPSGSITPFIDPRNNRLDTILNDAKADDLGRLWVGTYHETEREPRGELFRIEPNGESSTVIDQLICSNGPAFSPGGNILYIADSIRSTIYQFDVDLNSGSLGERKVFATVPRTLGFPDGMTVDCDGGLWNAHYGSGLITRYYPNGTIDFTVSLPAPYVTSCMFGGPNLSTLFVTTASVGPNGFELSPQAPLAGALFKIETHFEGLVEPEFLG